MLKPILDRYIDSQTSAPSWEQVPEDIRTEVKGALSAVTSREFKETGIELTALYENALTENI